LQGVFGSGLTFYIRNLVGKKRGVGSEKAVTSLWGKRGIGIGFDHFSRKTCITNGGEAQITEPIRSDRHGGKRTDTIIRIPRPD